jgi:acetoin utilization protein AcuB
MRVQELMNKPVITVSHGSTAEDAWTLMNARGVRHLVVTDDDGRVVGMLSHRDGGGRSGAAVRRNRTVAELMTEPVVTVAPDATLRKAASLMRGRSIGCLVVVESGRIVGIVTVSDLLELVGRGIDRGALTTKRWTLKHRAPHRKSRSASTVW